MELGFSLEEGRVLHGLMEDASGDIVVRLDHAGFIVHASRNAAELGMDMSSLLLMPHIADFAEADYMAEVAHHVAQVFAGEQRRGWIEFPVRNCSDDGACEAICTAAHCQHWYALCLKPVAADNGAARRAIGLLRSVQQKYTLQCEINVNARIDPRTGLANRDTFFAALCRGIDEGREQAMAVLAVDGLRAVLMQYGQRTADEVQWGFAKFLQTMTIDDAGPAKDLAQLDAERFAVLLPDMSVGQARIWAKDMLKTFSGLTVTSSRRAPELTASAGLAPVKNTVDWTMRQAELGLVMARAGGGMQVGMCGKPAAAGFSGVSAKRQA